jgi:hypothetical protein
MWAVPLLISEPIITGTGKALPEVITCTVGLEISVIVRLFTPPSPARHVSSSFSDNCSTDLLGPCGPFHSNGEIFYANGKSTPG